MNLVILGDCQSNGNNCLAHEILDQKESNNLQTWSLRYHKKIDVALKWMLKHLKENGTDFEHNTKNIQAMVWNYLRKQELKISWPSMLDPSMSVYNYSVNGAHFVGYLKRLKTHIEKYGNPDFIFVTDYFVSHQCTTFKWEGIRYYFEKSTYGDAGWDPELYSEPVHERLKARLEIQSTKNKKWHLRKHKKAYDQLIRYIRSRNIPYATIRFSSGTGIMFWRQVFDKFMKTDIDCVPERMKYQYKDGEDSRKKKAIQQVIADKVQSYINKKVLT